MIWFYAKAETERWRDRTMSTLLLRPLWQLLVECCSAMIQVSHSLKHYFTSKWGQPSICDGRDCKNYYLIFKIICCLYFFTLILCSRPRIMWLLDNSHFLLNLHIFFSRIIWAPLYSNVIVQFHYVTFGSISHASLYDTKLNIKSYKWVEMICLNCARMSVLLLVYL